MNSWNFPSRNFAETEGLSNAALAEFKGSPLKALAREICQNSLDATDKSGKPVVVKFKKHHMKIMDFPGMKDMKTIIDSCSKFWGEKGDKNTKGFIDTARRKLSGDTFMVLQISDYNTTGVPGAFDDEEITPWGSLVKGNSFSVKNDLSAAAGSFGIGKAAPFVTSTFQTVFYRTLDEKGVSAALGVSRLMAHNSIYPVPQEEDIVRRSVGYYGEDANKKPAVSIEALDEFEVRTECGTDLFVPGFNSVTSDESWVKDIFAEVVDNFLYSIYSGKLEVQVENRTLSKNTLESMLQFLGNKAKDASMFYRVLDASSNDVVTEIYENFHGMGSLRLNLLYENDLNKKVLVVRSSGMKIARIPSLPRSISFVGFLEICGKDLNEFFRGMENPKHNAWEPNRYDEPDRQKAKNYKTEVEEWVRESISKKLIESTGAESPVDMGDALNYQDSSNTSSQNSKEAIIDTVKNIDVIQREPKKQKTKILDVGGSVSQRSKTTSSGIIDDEGSLSGHRHRTGKRKGGKPTGRQGRDIQNGPDRIYTGMREVYISARIISKGNGVNKLIYTPEEFITQGLIEVVTKGENGKSLKVYVKDVYGGKAAAENGCIVVTNVDAKSKQSVEFEIAEKRNLALGVKAYGN